jgi:uncharacterized membrane protein
MKAGGGRVMAKQDQKQKQKKPTVNREQRKMRIQQLLFAALAILIIISFILTAIITL